MNRRVTRDGKGCGKRSSRKGQPNQAQCGSFFCEGRWKDDGGESRKRFVNGLWLMCGRIPRLLKGRRINVRPETNYLRRGGNRQERGWNVGPYLREGTPEPADLNVCRPASESPRKHFRVLAHVLVELTSCAEIEAGEKKRKSKRL